MLSQLDRERYCIIKKVVNLQMKVTITLVRRKKKKSLLFWILSTLPTSFIFGFTCFDATVMFKAEFQLFKEPFLEERDFRVSVTDEKLPKKIKEKVHGITEVGRDLNPEAQL